jgi:hypothetical protein
MASDVIQSRQDFHRVLQDAIRQVGDRIKKVQGKSGALDEIEFQLDAMWRWTVDDRTPTEDERKEISVGLIAVRELEPVDTPEEQEFVTNLHELNYYFDNWPDDPNVAAEG